MSLADELEKAIGANDESTQVSLWLDTGFPPLNYILSGRYDGGLPSARVIEIFGPPSAGKTAISTEVMKAAQKAGGVAAFFDHERSYDEGLGEYYGLSLDPSKWVFKKPRSFEEAIVTAIKLGRVIRGKKYIPDDAPIVCVFDSLASMVPMSKLAKEIDELNMNDNTALARVTSAVFPAFVQFLEELNMTAIFLNQVRTKLNVKFGDPTTTPGGDAPKFYASVRLKLSASAIGDPKNPGNRLGQRVTANTVKNKVNRPFQTVEWDFLFLEPKEGKGSGKFDIIGSTLDYMKKHNLIETNGNFLVWEGKSIYRSALVKKIEDEGLKDQLFALFPKT